MSSSNPLYLLLQVHVQNYKLKIRPKFCPCMISPPPCLHNSSNSPVPAYSSSLHLQVFYLFLNVSQHYLFIIVFSLHEVFTFSKHFGKYFLSLLKSFSSQRFL